MLGAFDLLVNPLIHQSFEANIDLFLCITAVCRVCAECHKHSHDAPTFLTPAAWANPVPLDMCRMARDLMTLKFRVALNQNLLYQQLGEGAQNGELIDSPPFSLEITGNNIIKEAALVVKTTIMGNSPIRGPPGSVELIADEETANTPLSQDWKGPKEENSHGP